MFSLRFVSVLGDTEGGVLSNSDISDWKFSISCLYSNSGMFTGCKYCSSLGASSSLGVLFRVFKYFGLNFFQNKS